ncbi:hypothetical protein SD71_10740 [Cohnella kolymensis]|uniref:Uncharacterized protein n=1 Tax=Cohnella kolymensis TaxID=1590652 RepID=A0ABR5A491_9BACL|nr:hypothetical protein [Cohnella kolymensis]KIL35861.1 hypothetical protein SD71_10740 [Cohnella kolymensis]
MDYLQGLLTGAVFSALIFLYLQSRKPKPAKHDEPDPEVKRKAKETHEHFQSLMNYDVSQALERKKVT